MAGRASHGTAENKYVVGDRELADRSVMPFEGARMTKIGGAAHHPGVRRAGVGSLNPIKAADWVWPASGGNANHTPTG